MKRTIELKELQKGQRIISNGAIFLLDGNTSEHLPKTFRDLYADQIDEENRFLLNHPDNYHFWTAWDYVINNYTIKYNDKSYQLMHVIEDNLYAIPVPLVTNESTEEPEMDKPLGWQHQNFVVICVILERFRRYSPAEFIQRCFKEHNYDHQHHLLNKYHMAQYNLFSFLPMLDLEHLAEVNIFLNGLIAPEERQHYDHSWSLGL